MDVSQGLKVFVKCFGDGDVRGRKKEEEIGGRSGFKNYGQMCDELVC